jgi:hypothetical protein|tara:strand:+ start:141 stop:1337 length:1197 start_codon:yes stop_codon:yes gene_type:complete
MKKKELKTLIKLNPLLLLGVICFFVGFAVTTIISSKNIEVSNKMVERMISSIPFFFFILQIVVIAPILEEYTYRYFITTKRKYHKFFFASLIVVVGFVTKNLYITSFIIIISYLAFYYRNDKKKYFTLLIFVSSISFSFSHIQNIFSSSTIALFSVILTLFGLGLLLMIVRIKYGILYSISLHMIYNGLIFLSIYYSSPNEINIDNENYSIELKRENILDFEFGTKINSNNQKSEIKGASISEILKSISPNRTNKFYHFENNLLKYNGSVRIKNGNFLSLISELNLSIDSVTSEKEGYYLTLDTTKIDLSENKLTKDEAFECRAINSLNNIIQTLSSNSNIPINIELDSIYLDEIFDLTYYSNFSINDNLQLLNSQHNLNISCDIRKIMVTDYYIKFN